MSPFDYVKSITYSKENLITDEKSEELYNPFIVNRALSRYLDCVMLANEMNYWNQLPKALQYCFLLNTVRPKKRFERWIKEEKNQDVQAVMQYYSVSMPKALEYLDVLNNNQVEKIKTSLYKGGIKDGGTIRN